MPRLFIFAFYLVSIVYTKEILILHSYHPQYNWTQGIIQGLDSAFVDKNYVQYVEFLDSKRNPHLLEGDLFANLFLAKYGNKQLDALLVSDDNALHFALKYRKNIHPHTPIFYCGINRLEDYTLEELANTNGISEYTDMQSTLNAALKQLPNTENLYVISDPTNSSQSNLKNFKLTVDTRGLKVTYFDKLTVAELVAGLKKIPKNSIVFFLNFFIDGVGKSLTAAESLQLIKANTKAPIYSSWDWTLGLGVVGGRMTSSFHQGLYAGKMVNSYFQGTPIEQLPKPNYQAMPFYFDVEQLKQLGIDQSLLPKNSILINEPPDFLTKYRTLFRIFAALILLLFSGLIFFMRKNQIRKANNEKLQEVLDAKVKELEASHQTKISYLKFLCQEIEIPTQSIIKTNQFIRAIEERSNTSVLMSSLNQSCNHLNDALAEIKELISIEEGFAKTKAKSIHLMDLFEEVLEVLTPFSAERKNALLLSFSSPIPKRVYGDPKKLRHILLALGKNALRFTKNGVIEFSIERLMEDQYKIYIQDSGSGIPESLQVQLRNQKFNEVESEKGMNLHLVQKLLQVLGSELQFQSTLGLGTRFYFILHLAEHKKYKPKIQTHKVLLLGMDSLYLKSVTSWFEQQGFIVCSALSFSEIPKIIPGVFDIFCFIHSSDSPHLSLDRKLFIALNQSIPHRILINGTPKLKESLDSKSIGFSEEIELPLTRNKLIQALKHDFQYLEVEGKNILLFSPKTSIIDSLIQQWTHADYTVDHCENLEKISQQLTEYDYDYFILNIRRKDLSKIALIKAIQEGGIPVKNPHLKLIGFYHFDEKTQVFPEVKWMDAYCSVAELSATLSALQKRK